MTDTTHTGLQARPVPALEAAPEWHLANLLRFICPDHRNLLGLRDDDSVHMMIHLRVGDILAAHRSVASCFGSDGKEEARWIEDMKNACPHCGGSGHKDDVTHPTPAAATTYTPTALAQAFLEGLEAATECVAADYICDAIRNVENPYGEPAAATTNNTALVEALVWRKGNHSTTENAYSAGVPYSVGNVHGTWMWFATRFDEEGQEIHDKGRARSLNDAKRKANQHNAKRIRAALASRPAEATSRDQVEVYRKRYKYLTGIVQLPPKASDAGTA